MSSEEVIDFPTLGFLGVDWIENHCVIPDSFNRGNPFILSGWQLVDMAYHYRVKPDAEWRPDTPMLASAFSYRRTQIVRPQKALALDTPVATLNGWSTMGSLEVGDKVFDQYGNQTEVVSKSPVWMSDTYRVTFTDGSELTACGDHEWVVERMNTSAKHEPMRVSTRWMRDDGLVDSGGARKFRVQNRDFDIRQIEPVPTEPTQCVTVDSPTHTFLAGKEMIPTGNTGKSPLAAAMVCAEALGPVLFAGWAEGGETYRCADHGCGCGWVSEPFEPGDPMGMPWPTPLIQLTATSVDQVGNVYDALRPMIEYGPLFDVVPRLGEEFIRLPNGGRIDAVTSKARSRLGQRVTFCVWDESGLFRESNGMIDVAETQRRGLAGMGGRSLEVTNPWNPAEDSVAQRTYEAELDDVFVDFPQPPPHLSYTNKQERHRIHRFVYEGSPWVDLDNIEAESYELLQFDPGQAERFFGNRVVYGQGQWLHGETWDAKAEPKTLDKTYRVEIVLGFDGSDVDDWTALRAETKDGYMFTPTYGPEKLPTIWNPAEFGGQVPRLEVSAAVGEVFRTYHVVRMYADPPGWETEIDEWAEEHGGKIVIRWPTYRGVAMHTACERLRTDTQKLNSGFSHDGCSITAAHVRNARMSARKDDRYVLAKASQTQKIDACIASILTHEAAGDVAAKGLWRQTYGIKMA